MEKGRGKGTDTLQTDNDFTRKEYIEREAAKKVICDYCSCVQLCSRNENDCWAIEALQAIPAADVVPVVRCRECKHRDPEDKKCDCGGLEHAHMFPVADDWFCADGERTDGDGE